MVAFSVRQWPLGFAKIPEYRRIAKAFRHDSPLRETSEMPIYEYECGSCGNQFEQLVRGAERPECPTCGSRQLDKQFSVPAAHTGTTTPPCAVKDAGQCDVSNCCGQGCNLDFGGM